MAIVFTYICPPLPGGASRPKLRKARGIFLTGACEKPSGFESDCTDLLRPMSWVQKNY